MINQINKKTGGNGQFKQGNPGGPGRPKGSKNKFTKVKEEIVELFDKLDGVGQLRRHINNNPEKFYRFTKEIILPVLPKDPLVQNNTQIVNVDYGWTDTESETSLRSTDVSEGDS